MLNVLAFSLLKIFFYFHCLSIYKSEHIMHFYKSKKISMGAVIISTEMLKFVSDHFNSNLGGHFRSSF